VKGYIPFCRASIGKRELSAVAKVLRSGWLTTGPRTAEFEEEFRKYVGARHAVAMSSCTAALHVALAAKDVGKGGEVITTPFTFASTANVVEHVGAKPVFCDVEEDTFNIDPALAEEAVSEKTRAIIPVHYAGHPCDMDPIGALAKKRGIFVLEDAAHAVGAKYKSRSVGVLGDAAAFSFYVTKNMTTGEGGMLTCADGALAERAKRLRLHGMSRDALKRYGQRGSWYYELTDAGFKCNMTDMQAALGLVQLGQLDAFNRKRSRLAALYSELLEDVGGFTLPVERKNVKRVWHLYPVLADFMERGKFIREMAAEGVGCSVHFIPLHLQPFYAKKYGYRRGDFPVAERVYDRVVSLPLFPSLGEAGVRRVVAAIRRVKGRNA